MKKQRLQDGHKTPFTKEQVQLVRASLKAAGAARDLALFETSISTMLRASDLLGLRVSDVTGHDGAILEELRTQQQKTHFIVKVLFMPKCQEALRAWIDQSGYRGNARLFPMTKQWYGQLVKGWAKLCYLDPRKYSTHSMRRTWPTLIYGMTKDVETCRQLLGHRSASETSAYLGINHDKAASVARDRMNEI